MSSVDKHCAASKTTVQWKSDAAPNQMYRMEKPNDYPASFCNRSKRSVVSCSICERSRFDSSGKLFSSEA
jgi:hypothetical protein